MYGWGALYLKASGAKPTVRDVTLEKIGYQTDNGAFYCFCKPNCSNTSHPAIQLNSQRNRTEIMGRTSYAKNMSKVESYIGEIQREH